MNLFNGKPYAPMSGFGCSQGLAIFAALALPAALARAETPTDDATTQSEDAFGRQIGTEKSGIYTNDYVRGFDPVDAGNSRIDGLFFDQLDRLPGRIVDQSAIRVGITAQRFAFPAPSGLVDYTLRRPNGLAEATLDLRGGPKFGGVAQLEFAMPIDGSRLGFTGGFSERWRREAEGHTTQSINWGLLADWRPRPGAEFYGFGGLTVERNQEVEPTIFPDGQLPPKIERGKSLAQPWAVKEVRRSTDGMVAKFPVGGMRLELGAFYAWRLRPQNFSDLASGVTADGSIARRTIVADEDSSEQSFSGELRLVKEWETGQASHRLILSARGRKKDRVFGGGQRIDLGASTLLEADPRAEPVFAFGPKNSDDAREIALGTAYGLLFGSKLSFDFGLSKSFYTKDVDFADAALADTHSEDRRFLWNGSASYSVAPWVTFFAGISRGLEEAPTAPDRAINRSEAPPAIATRQEEAGVKLSLARSLTLVSGVFRLSKPYYNLDPVLRYRSLGEVTMSGVEFSLAGSLAPGLTVVAGAVFIRPEISGEAVREELIGSRPVGQARIRTALNLDWRLDRGEGPWSFDIALQSASAMYADAANILEVPGYANFDLGARYRFQLGTVALVLRPKIENLFNEYSWRVSQNGGLTYSAQRNYSLQLIADL